MLYTVYRGEYYSCLASVTYFSKDKALYKACPNQVKIFFMFLAFMELSL